MNYDENAHCDCGCCDEPDCIYCAQDWWCPDPECAPDPQPQSPAITTQSADTKSVTKRAKGPK